jgi:hypothetical protein
MITDKVSVGKLNPGKLSSEFSVTPAVTHIQPSYKKHLMLCCKVMHVLHEGES